MIDLNKYKKVANNTSEYESVKVKTFIPNPIEIDYKRGYVTRYFVQKANDTESQIYEVDYIGFNKVINNPFFSKVSLNWRIKGTDEQIKDSNSKAIRLVSSTIPKLPLYLPNLLQFKEKKDLAI